MDDNNTDDILPLRNEVPKKLIFKTLLEILNEQNYDPAVPQKEKFIKLMLEKRKFSHEQQINQMLPENEMSPTLSEINLDVKRIQKHHSIAGHY